MQEEEDVGAGIEKREEHFLADESGVLRGGCGEGSRGADAREPRGGCLVACALEQSEKGGVVGGECQAPGTRTMVGLEERP